MNIGASFDQNTNEIINQKHKSTCLPPNGLEEQSFLQEKLSLLENQYVQMEIEYSKKIKELKNVLGQKSRKQASLMNQITNLRINFKTHQEEIAKVGAEITVEESQQIQIKHSKKASSPGLIKKSLENDKKYEKKQSPTHQQSKMPIKLIGQLKKTQSGNNASPRIKRRSPRGNQNGIFQFFKQDSSQQAASPKQKKTTQCHSGKKQPQKTSGDNKKKAYSPKNIQETKTIIQNIAKNIKKQGPTQANGSPRRPIRRSPGQKGGLLKLDIKKQGKLGRLKETAQIQQVF